jgi:hypothetical protein
MLQHCLDTFIENLLGAVATLVVTIANHLPMALEKQLIRGREIALYKELIQLKLGNLAQPKVRSSREGVAGIG